MLRRLYHEQPESFTFTPANQAWAEAQLTKYPEGRQASAIIPLLWRAQEQEGWLSRPAIEHVADMLGMDYIRALEVATFYFMFQLQPVGSTAHVQICGTLSCMIMGSETLMDVCKRKIAGRAFERSPDGKFSWEEVECLGSCSNAPMVQIGKDYYEDLTPERFEEILDELAAGKVPVPGPQNGRYGAEPLSGLTALGEYESGRTQYNATVSLAVAKGDTVKRIDGSEEALRTPWRDAPKPAKAAKKAAKPKAAVKPAPQPAQAEAEAIKPATLSGPREAGADDLKQLKGVGPKLEKTLNELGFYHFDQIAKWSEAEVAWVDDNLKFKGRVQRDGWIEQAKVLAAGGETAFSTKVKKGDVY
jgi:NADH-quinone oxidoreductase subunit E